MLVAIFSSDRLVLPYFVFELDVFFEILHRTDRLEQVFTLYTIIQVHAKIKGKGED